MMKLCPSWKVYQGWMGCDPFDSIGITLYEVTVNEQPTKVIINRKRSKIGLTIPPNVLARADKVIR